MNKKKCQCKSNKKSKPKAKPKNIHPKTTSKSKVTGLVNIGRIIY